MWSWDYTIYLGENSDDVHVGFAADTNFFVIAEIAGPEEPHFSGDLEVVKQRILAEPPASLAAFESLLSHGLARMHDTLHALAAAYLVPGGMYLVTRGDGAVYGARDGLVHKLISGDSSASGHLQTGDAYLLVNKRFISTVGEKRTEALLVHSTPQESIESITPELKATDDSGMFGLFMTIAPLAVLDEELRQTEVVDEPDEADSKLQLTEGDDADAFVQAEQDMPVDRPQSVPDAAHTYENQPALAPVAGTPVRRKFSFPSLLHFSGLPRMSSPIGKRVTLVIAVILACVLGWSALSGNARRTKAQFEERASADLVLVQQSLDQADESSSRDAQVALKHIADARAIMTTLSVEAQKKRLTESPVLKQMADMIAAAEQRIKKIAEGSYEEFYDMALIDKDAQASALFFDGDVLALLNQETGAVYLLSLAEKSVETRVSKQSQGASHVAMHQSVPYTFSQTRGVLQIPEDGGEKEMVAKDDEWSSIKDFWMYNGNIYLLEEGKDEVYKYLVATEGYSSKRSYFGEGESVDLEGASAMAIDSSLYIAVGSRVLKYTSGVRDSFQLGLPDESAATFEDIYTNADIEEVYLLDKDSRRIFVTRKDGEFVKQIPAAVIADADDFIVDEENGILILADNKLYKISP